MQQRPPEIGILTPNCKIKKRQERKSWRSSLDRVELDPEKMLGFNPNDLVEVQNVRTQP